MRTLLLPTILLTFAAPPMFAAQPDYFPLHVGNQWVYRIEGRVGAGGSVVVDIPRTETVNNRIYSVVRGLDDSREILLRSSEEGAVYVRNMERLQKKFHTAARITPQPLRYSAPRRRASA